MSPTRKHLPGTNAKTGSAGGCVSVPGPLWQAPRTSGLNLYPLRPEASRVAPLEARGRVPSMPLPGSGGCWSSSDIPWLVDAAHESLRRRHVAFCRGRCPNYPRKRTAVVGAGPTESRRPPLKACLDHSAQLLSPSTTVSEVPGGHELGDAIPLRRTWGCGGTRSQWRGAVLHCCRPPGL